MTTKAHKIRTAALLLAAAAALTLPGAAKAVGGSYTIVGGTADQQAQVKAALDATRFNWSCVPVNVRISLAAGVATQAVPGQIQIDTNLLDAGTFAWGVVQHEYAHQVDWYVLRPDVRTALARALGGATWGIGITAGTGVEHDQLTGERFADELTWAFWPTGDNAITPPVKTFAPKAFRAYLGALIKAAPQATATATALTAATTVTAAQVKG